MNRTIGCKPALIGIGAACQVIWGGLTGQRGVSDLFKIGTSFRRWAKEDLATFIQDKDLVELLVDLFPGLVSVEFRSDTQEKREVT